MPKVSINIIKDWFKNQMKPPQEQFWSWLDSFWHKDEPIPQTAVENLVPTLQRKADLVDGVVPESQLPFSVVTSEVISLGTPSVTGNKVNLSVHSSGANVVRVKGKTITRMFPNEWTITPVVATGIKVLRGYAVKTEDDFFLAEGPEQADYEEPEIPVNALEIFRIILRLGEVIVEPQNPVGFKYKEEDGWRNITLNQPLTVLPYTFDLRSSYWINSAIVGPTIGGIRNALIDRNASPTWDGKEFWIYNNTGYDLPLNSDTVIEEDVFLFANAITLKDKHSCKVKIRRDALEIVGVLGGEAFDPTTLQSQIDAEIVTRVIEDNKKLDKPLSPNNTSDRLIQADGGTTGKKNYQRNGQFFIPLPATISEDWNGMVVFFTGSGTLTAPNNLSTAFTFNAIVDTGVSVTFSITSPKTWYSTPPTANASDMFTFLHRGDNSKYQIVGI